MKKLAPLALCLALLSGLLFAHALLAQSPGPKDCDDLFFSEYVEGTGYNKALEIYNSASQPIALSAYQITVSFNGGTSERTLPLTGTLAAGETLVLVNSRADPGLLARADITDAYVLNFNGADAIVLQKAGAPIDVIGQIGGTPGDFWGIEPVTTQNHTLRRKPYIAHGDPQGNDPFDPAREWEAFPVNTWDGLGYHAATCPSPTPQGPPTPTATPAWLRPAIHDIQAASHLSPLRGQTVFDVPGIVTAVLAHGYFMQTPDADVDADPATSEGVYVYTNDPPTVAVGDAVQVTGMVTEYYGRGSRTGLATTEIQQDRVTILAHSQPLPTATLLGAGGRMPPTAIIEDDANGSVNNTGEFDPDHDALDFYESLEGMLVQVRDPVVVGPTDRFGTIPIVGDHGTWGGVYASRGVLVVRPDDFNPERLLLDDVISKEEPKVSVGDYFTGTVTGILDYSYGAFKLLNIHPLPPVQPGPLTEETASLPPANALSIATMNLENLDPGDSDEKFAGLASDIVHHLLAPDILGVEEVQDNSGSRDDGVVDADQTFQKLVDAIVAAGGPTYAFREIPPQNNMDGGQPGGNIRVGFLFRPDRVTFVDRPGGDATTPVQVLPGPNGPQLSISPGRVDPENPAWDESRKPLAGEFLFQGQTLFVIVNHFNSKGGDDPLFGRYQPPRRPSQVQRREQGRVVQRFVADILAQDPQADVVVLGDFNDFWFSDAVRAMEKDDVLHNLITWLPEKERYTYLYQGNGQTLDHILVSPHMLTRQPDIDIIHANAEFVSLPQRATDHDPVLARFRFEGGPDQPLWLPFVMLPREGK